MRSRKALGQFEHKNSHEAKLCLRIKDFCVFCPCETSHPVLLAGSEHLPRRLAWQTRLRRPRPADLIVSCIQFDISRIDMNYNWS